MAIGAVVVLALAWGLFGGSESEPPVDEATDQTEPDFEPVADGRLDPDDFPAPAPDRQTDGDGPNNDGTDEDGRAPLIRIESTPGEPLVGELTGLGLVVSSPDTGEPVADQLPDGEALRIVSLDSGIVHELAGVDGWPVGAIGTTLIFQMDSSIVALDLKAPERGLTSIWTEGGGQLQWSWVDREVVWIVDTGEDGTFPSRAVAYSADGRLVDQMELQSGIFSILWRSTSDLVFNRASGIYRRSESGLELLSDGVLLAVGERSALVHTCDDDMRCLTSWHDRDTWERRPFAQPPGNPIGALTNLMGDDRWVVSTGIYDGITTITEAATGEVVEEVQVSLDGLPDNGVTISPDGRWLVGPSSGDEKVMDLDEGTVWLTGIVLPPDHGRLLVDLTGTAFDDR